MARRSSLRILSYLAAITSDVEADGPEAAQEKSVDYEDKDVHQLEALASRMIREKRYATSNPRALLRRIRQEIERLWRRGADARRQIALADQLEIELIKIEHKELVDGLRRGTSRLAPIEAVTRCRALEAQAAKLNEPIIEGEMLLVAIEELEWALESAGEALLDGPEYETGAQAKRSFDRALARATKYGLGGDYYLAANRRLERELIKGELERMLFVTQDGEVPPDTDEKRREYELLIARARGAELDASSGVAALQRAREVRQSWQNHEPADDNETPPPNASGTSWSPGTRSRLDVHIKTVAAFAGRGDGGRALRDIAWALLALDEGACVRLEGQQLVLVEHLASHGVLGKKPCERAARAAIRKLLRFSPLVEHPARRRWVYRLDELRKPSRQMLEAVKIYDASRWSR